MVAARNARTLRASIYRMDPRRPPHIGGRRGRRGPANMKHVSRLTLFSWGYWGWGNHTARLVEAIDAIESARGFAPPLLVDVRYSRGVRAVGFREQALQQLVGAERYRWLRGLGNRAIHESTGPAVVIANPSAASELLDLSVTAARSRRRVIFFCACEVPRTDEGTTCHRVEAGRLVLRAAAHRQLPMTIVEWPGGDTGDIAIEVGRPLLRQIRRGRTSVPLRGSSLEAAPAGLAHGTLVTATAGEEQVRFVSGPTRYSTDGWFLPVLHVFDSATRQPRVENTFVEDLRRVRGWLPRHSAGAAHPDDRNRGRELSTHCPLAPSCIYTILDLRKLDQFAAGDGSGGATEGRQWVSGQRLLREASASGQRLAILFADAADCTRLHYWALLTVIRLSERGTEYRFESLTPIRHTATPQDLVLAETGASIASGFIRPYALCRTPTFLAPAG